MAQPVNLYDSGDMVGLREDLSDRIFNIAPYDTPLMSKCEKTKASNITHEWQTDTLRSSADNAHIEGEDTLAEAATPTVRLNNYAQIFKNSVSVSGTESAIKKAGRGSEMAYQTLKIVKEHKKDIEKALFANQAKVARSGSTPGRLAGVPAWLKTNTVNETNSSGADPTGDGTNARTDNGSVVAFSQDRFDSSMRARWEAGGDMDGISVYLSAFQMDVALGFVGNNAQRNTVSTGKVTNNLTAYTTPWGTVKFVMSRECRGRDVLILQDDMWALAQLRGTTNSPLPTLGDSEQRQIITELTLVCRNEAASGAVFDNTTS